MWSIELSLCLATLAPGLYPVAVFVDLDDPRIVIAVADKDIACHVPRHVGGPVEEAGPRRRSGRARPGLFGAALDQFPLPAQYHQHLALGAELDHHVRALVYAPDVVVLVHSDHVREVKPVQISSDLSQKLAITVKFEQPRMAAPGEDKNMSLGIQRDSCHLAKVKLHRQFDRIRGRLKWYFPRRLPPRPGTRGCCH